MPAQVLIRSAAAALLVSIAAAPPPAVPASAGGPDWGAVPGPSPLPSAAIGGHARGCLAGAVALPADGPAHQAMRPSRNRVYGHPVLIEFVQALAAAAQAQGRPGLLVGDLAQPRGGPMTYGHRSHQTGLDVDIWFLPAPARRLTPAEREEMPAVSMVATDGETVDPAAWTPEQAELLRLAASFPQVDRIFVNPAIKRQLCAESNGDRAWLARIRPWWGHDAHFHVGLRCPAGETACIDREPPLPPGDGCDAQLAWWFSDEAKEQQRQAREAPPRRLTLDDLPAGCRPLLGFE